MYIYIYTHVLCVCMYTCIYIYIHTGTYTPSSLCLTLPRYLLIRHHERNARCRCTLRGDMLSEVLGSVINLCMTRYIQLDIYIYIYIYVR